MLFNLEGTGKDVPEYGKDKRGFSSAGRAPALQAGGQRFDPANLHQPKESKRLTEVPWQQETSLNFLTEIHVHLEN